MKNKNLTTGEILEIKRKLIIKFETCIVATFADRPHIKKAFMVKQFWKAVLKTKIKISFHDYDESEPPQKKTTSDAVHAIIIFDICFTSGKKYHSYEPFLGEIIIQYQRRNYNPRFDRFWVFLEVILFCYIHGPWNINYWITYKSQETENIYKTK